MKTDFIEIIDRGRGPQLSTCRITVLDLVPYFQKANSYERIARWIPILSQEEIAIAERFYLVHQAEFDDLDRRARERRGEQIRQQRRKFPELNGSHEERLARLRDLLKKRQREKDIERIPG